MPEIHNKTIHSFSSEDPQFPATNLLETRVTKKWKCKEAGEKSCYVVLKLDQPRLISGIDIGNERSGFIEVFVGNSKQDPPEFKEILLATSFMTIIEAKNGNNPTRVRCFASNALVESVAKQQWDLVKVLCTQPFNNKTQYGLSFITLHTPEVITNDDSPIKIKPTTNATSTAAESDEKKSKFGKFKIRENSDSDSDNGMKKESPFNRWKSQSVAQTQSTKTSIKEQFKSKLDENRKRIRMMSDSSDDEVPKPKEKAKPNRNRTSGLVYEDEDDEPNEKLQKKMDKDKELKEKDQRTPKLLTKRDKSPSKPGSKFASFIDDDVPSTSSASGREKSTPDKSKPSFSSRFSSSSSKKPSPKKSPQHEKTIKTKPLQQSSKKVTYKPFHRLLEGVVFVFSGYVNPERGTLRQKAIDMGAKYKPDWDNCCTHLICAFGNTPKYQQVKGKGKIVTKRWIEACFDEQKKLSWRRFALDKEDRDEPESEDEIVNEMLKPNQKIVDSDSDGDMVVVDKRKMNGNEMKPIEVIDEEPIDVIDEYKSSQAMEVSTDDEMMNKSDNGSVLDLTQAENQVFKNKVFYLNEDLPATDVIKLKNQITAMMGKISDKSKRADFVITDKGRKLPESTTAEVLLSLWVFECYELGAFIPTTRYKPKHLL